MDNYNGLFADRRIAEKSYLYFIIEDLAMKTATNLASVFLKIEAAAVRVDDIAKEILAALQASKATTLEAFNNMVDDAYQRNNWSQKAGRRLPGDTTAKAPQAVRMYVSTIRRAYRLNLRVLSFSTMNEMRVAISDATRVEPPPDKPEVLRGVQLSAAKTLTGALIHDVAVLYDHLPDDQQVEFERQLRRLLTRYTKAAPPDLLQQNGNGQRAAVH